MTNTRNDLVAVVTGAGRGIGQDLALRLAADGASVVVNGLADVSETVGLIEKAGGKAIGVVADVSTEDGVELLRAKAAEAFGTVNVVVNNAGLMPGAGILDVTVEEWDRVQATNVRGSFLVSRAFVPGMKELGWGRIVEISSTSFFIPMAGMLAYITSKGAMIAFGRALSAEAGDWGITVNTIASGAVVTPGTQEEGWADLFPGIAASAQALKRVGRGSDVAGALAFLVSDDASHMTGQTLVVDGGMAHV